MDILENQENEITFHDNTDKNNDLWLWGLYKTQSLGYICQSELNFSVKRNTLNGIFLQDKIKQDIFKD